MQSQIIKKYEANKESLERRHEYLKNTHQGAILAFMKGNVFSMKK